MSFFKGLRRVGQSTTQLKVKQATDSNESYGATGTLMNELSVLTYSEKSANEIYEVIRKRLMNGSSRLKNSHDSVVQVLKTLTLIEYLLYNGSEEFVLWMRRHLAYIEALKDYHCSNDKDKSKVKQIKSLSEDISKNLKEDDFLEKRRLDIIMFRSSISTPGRKSTDNSHLNNRQPASVPLDEDILPEFKSGLQTRSLDLQRRRSTKYSTDRVRYLATLAEEDDGP
ncbi:Ent4 [Kluyveromyces lactis]|nr:Ent4 [Kluyveromyces lactis]